MVRELDYFVVAPREDDLRRAVSGRVDIVHVLIDQVWKTTKGRRR